MLREFPQVAATHAFQYVYPVQPFHKYLTASYRIAIKDINFSYAVDRVFAEIPNLRHGNDGLIYTCVSTPYIAGTDVTLYAPYYTHSHAFTDTLQV